MDMLAADTLWIVYLGLIIGPFVQEDLAVIGAAGLSITMPEMTAPIFAAVFAGLVLSDIWKYGIGGFARKNSWAMRQAAKPNVAAASAKIKAHPGKTLMTVRFIPFTRIPAYIAAGFVKVPYGLFCFWVALSGLIYIAIIFALFHTLGMVVGEHVKTFIPLGAITLVALFLGYSWITQKHVKKD